MKINTPHTQKKKKITRINKPEKNKGKKYNRKWRIYGNEAEEAERGVAEGWRKGGREKGEREGMVGNEGGEGGACHDGERGSWSG